MNAVTVPKNSCATRDKAPAVQLFLSFANCWTTLVVLPNITKGIGVFVPQCGDADTCAIIELNHSESVVFRTPRAKTPTRAETPIRAKTPILTAFLCFP